MVGDKFVFSEKLELVASARGGRLVSSAVPREGGVDTNVENVRYVFGQTAWAAACEIL